MGMTSSLRFRHQNLQSKSSVWTTLKGPFTPSVSVKAAMTLAIPFSLKTMESLQNAVATYFQVTPLISMRIKSLVSSQSCRSLDADVWCKRALRTLLHQSSESVTATRHFLYLFMTSRSHTQTLSVDDPLGPFYTNHQHLWLRRGLLCLWHHDLIRRRSV